MAQIRVSQPFTLNLGATTLRFAPGTADVSEEVADHWYTKLFAERIAPLPIVEPQANPVEGQAGAPPAGSENQPDVYADDAGEAEQHRPSGDDAAASAIDADGKAALKAEAEALGIVVDGRWGVDRIKAAIEAAKVA